MMAEPEQRVAVLLNLLGKEVSESALAALPEARAAEVRRHLDGLGEQRPSVHEIDEVLEEFQRLFQLVAHEPAPRLRLVGSGAPETPAGEGEAERPDDAPSEKRSFPKFEPTDDPIADLHRLDPAQIAAALKGEHPRSISMVLNNLSASKAIETIGALPESMRSTAFVQLKDGATESEVIVQRVIATTVAKALRLEPEDIEQRDMDQQMAEILRGMPKKTRIQMLRSLEEEDLELAERVKARLFVFEDILRLEQRSLQQLLGEVEAETLCIALQRAPKPLVERVLASLSKRARATLQEEMDYQRPADAERIEEARKEIAAIMVRLDDEGKLIMES